jgi:hypothetical protein
MTAIRALERKRSRNGKEGREGGKEGRVKLKSEKRKGGREIKERKGKERREIILWSALVELEPLSRSWRAAATSLLRELLGFP